MRNLLSTSKQILVILIALLGMSTGAFATTLNFDNLPGLIVSPDPQIYQESGYQITPTGFGDFGSFGSGGIHFDICCGPYTDSVTLTRTGGGQFLYHRLIYFFILKRGFCLHISDLLSLLGFVMGANLLMVVPDLAIKEQSI